MRKIFFLAFLLFSGVAHATKYQLEWQFPKELDFDVSVYELSPAFGSKVGSSGVITEPSQLLPIKEIKNGIVDLASQNSIVLGLVFKSRSGKAADFYVAPHSTEPGQASLGFQFNCLCYHHAYHMKKGLLWYRILKLSSTGMEAEAGAEGKIVHLKHQVVVWKGEAEKK